VKGWVDYIIEYAQLLLVDLLTQLWRRSANHKAVRLGSERSGIYIYSLARRDIF